jgi:hypothetical protein
VRGCRHPDHRGCRPSNQASDAELLPGQIDQVKGNTGRYPEKALADAGYFSEDNLQYLAKKGIEAYIPLDKIRHGEWRQQAPYEGPIPGAFLSRTRGQGSTRMIKG